MCVLPILMQNPKLLISLTISRNSGICVLFLLEISFRIFRKIYARAMYYTFDISNLIILESIFKPTIFVQIFSFKNLFECH